MGLCRNNGHKSKAAAAAKSLQSCLTLCDPIDGSPPGSPIPGILQARTLEWVAISFSNAEKWKVKVRSLSHIWLCDRMDCSLPGSSIHGIFQARVLEWVAIAFSSVQFSCLVVSDSLLPHESQHTRPPCPSPSPGVHSNLCPRKPLITLGSSCLLVVSLVGAHSALLRPQSPADSLS